MSNQAVCSVAKSYTLLAREMLTGAVAVFAVVILTRASGSGQSQTPSPVPSPPSRWAAPPLTVVPSACPILPWTCLMSPSRSAGASLRTGRSLKVCRGLRHEAR